MIQAIETQYKGYRFRSRLEARWAVFFDILNIRYIYEHEGFKLCTPGDNFEFLKSHHNDLSPKFVEFLAEEKNKDLYYLPDFYLPDLDLWAEVKGHGSLDDYGKIVRLVNYSNKSLMLLGELDRPPVLLSPHCAIHETVEPRPIMRLKNTTQEQWDEALIAARSARFEHGETPKVPRGKVRI